MRINELILNREGNELQFRVSCSKGTYIRSLAHDIGKALGSGAHLSELRRTAIGDFKVDQALTVNAYLSKLQSELPDTN